LNPVEKNGHDVKITEVKLNAMIDGILGVNSFGERLDVFYKIGK
jgi:hypothetical protein